MIEEIERTAQQPEKMPFGIKAFFGYSILLVICDIVSCTNLSLGRIIVPNIGREGSACYGPALVLLLTGIFSTRFLKLAKPWKKGMISMRYGLLALMLLEIGKYMLDREIDGKADHLHYYPYTIGPLRVVVSVVIPLFWISVWFSGSAARYLRSL